MSTKLKPGYKQTEVGVIPEDWEVATLSEVCCSITDGTHFTPRYVKAGVPFYSVENVTADNFSDTKFISEEEHSILIRRCKPERGDILLTRIGSLGDTKLLNWDVRASIYVSLALLKLNDRAVPEFLYSYTKSPGFVRDVERRSLLNAAPKKINMADIGGVPVPMPRSESEQRAIATVLRDLDALLGGLQKLIAKKRDLKQAAMQQLLTPPAPGQAGQTRLPGISGPWEVKRVAELGEVVTGGTPRTDVKEYWGGEFPWITPTDISNHRDIYASERSLTQKGLNAIRWLPADTVLVTCIASIGKNTILKTKGGCNQQINAVVPNKNNSPEFLYYLFEASKQYLLANAGTTATSIVSKATFKELIFAVPYLAEQAAIAAVLSDMDRELAALEQRLAKTRALKQGMMQELLTGRIRLV